MKGKKGFTLIELLAVIVIIAIIAVITVPVVLNIIEESKFGAAKDSALGYKDAVHKYYASRLSLDSNFKMVDSTYEIDSNGYLSDGTNTYEIQIDGKVPSSGYVQIERNVVKNACIGYDDYAVLISDGNISDTAKGECTSVSEIVAVGEEPLEVGTEYLFPYVSEGDNKEQTLEIVRSGYYKLEVWGAQGGSSITTGGYGGYSSGYVRLTRGTILYINVGEQPTDLNGGHGGGGSGYVGYSDLNNGVMYCYGCTDDSSSGTKTISTTGSNKDSVNCPNGYSNSALSNCAKSGNGYAVITYIGESLN